MMHRQKIPDGMREKWARLYRDDGLNVKEIQERFPGWDRKTISAAIKEQLGINKLEYRRADGAGW